MNALDLARWQFGITTIYHFLFMPLSIGLSLPIAIMQTAWFRTRSPKYLAMTRFWGKVEAELAVYAGRAQRPAPVSSAFSCRFSDSSSWRLWSENSRRKDGMTSKTAATKMTTRVTRIGMWCRCGGERQAGAGQQHGVLGHAPAEHDGRHAQDRQRAQALGAPGGQEDHDGESAGRPRG